MPLNWQMMFKSVAIFCGSKTGRDPIYEQHAKDLGKLLAQNDITLVYGGADKGLMGTVANAALKQNGKVIGVIPELLKELEHQHEGISKMYIVADMHVRKKMMYEMCDAAIILPGGFGTLDELFEMVTWNNLNIHNKKIILLNSAGYYNFLIGHINNMQSQDFLYTDWKDQLKVFETPDAIFSWMDANKNQNLPG